MSTGLPSRRIQGRFSAQQIAAMYPNLRADRLRCLEKWGLVHTTPRTGPESEYGFSDLAVIRQASADLGRGMSFRAVLRQLQAAHDGQLALDFDHGFAPARLVALAAPAVSERASPHRRSAGRRSRV